MKKLLYFAFLSFFAFFGCVTADTIDIKWTLDNQTYTTTTCTVGGDVILPNPPTKHGHVFRGWKKSIFRGTFANWSYVPSDPSYYNEYDNNTTPQNGDYIIVTDASAWVAIENTIILEGAYYHLTVTFNGESDTFDWPSGSAYPYQTTASGKIKIARQYGSLACFANTDNLKYNGNVYNTDEQIFGAYQWSSDRYPNKIYTTTQTYDGTWRFVYDGVWETDGINGWKPAEQIINE